MDILEFYLGVLAIVTAGILVWSFIRIKGRIAEQKLAEELRVSAEKRKYAMMKAKASRNEQIDSSDVSPWVNELLSNFGISPEVLFEDEMPAELKRLLPLVKGFVQTGGIQKVLGAVQGPEVTERTAI